METLGEAEIDSSAPPEAFFARWADTATWPEWNTDTAWVRLDGPFVEGATGRLKSRGGPAVSFVVDRLDAEHFVDISRLFGARMTFAHTVTRTPTEGSSVHVAVTIEGPIAWLWKKIIGGGIAASLQPDLSGLAAVAEADVRAAAGA